MVKVADLVAASQVNVAVIVLLDDKRLFKRVRALEGELYGTTLFIQQVLIERVAKRKLDCIWFPSILALLELNQGRLWIVVKDNSHLVIVVDRFGVDDEMVAMVVKDARDGGNQRVRDQEGGLVECTKDQGKSVLVRDKGSSGIVVDDDLELTGTVAVSAFVINMLQVLQLDL